MLASVAAVKATGLVIALNPLATVDLEAEAEAEEAGEGHLLAEVAPTLVLVPDLHVGGPGGADLPERTGPYPENGTGTGQRGRRGPPPARGIGKETSPDPEAPGRDLEADLVLAHAKIVPLRLLPSAQDLLRLLPRGMTLTRRMGIMPTDMRTETRTDHREMIKR